MGDEDVQRLERQYESLLKEYGVLKVEQIRHEERLSEGKADRAEIRSEARDEFADVRAAMKELRGDMLSAVGRSEQRTRERIDRVGQECHGFWDEYRRDRERAIERREQEREEARRQLEREREEARKQLAEELAKARDLAQRDAQGDKEWSRQKKLAVAGMLLAFATAVVASIITAAATILGG